MTSHCAWAACGLSAQGVDFGNYDPFSRQNMDGTGGFAVTCDVGDAYSIALSAGSGTYAARKMTDGTQVLTYNLYTDAARVVVWGDGTGATATVGGVGTGITTHVPVYGRMAARQNVHVGAYVDNIVVTIIF